MAELGEMLAFLVLMAAAGAATGGVSGLLGGGGGLFAPAALFFAFDALGHGGGAGMATAAGTACALTAVLAFVAWRARASESGDGATALAGAVLAAWPLALAGLLGAVAASALGGRAVLGLLGAVLAVAAVNRAMAAVGSTTAPASAVGGGSGTLAGRAAALGAAALSAATGIGASAVLAPLAVAGGDATARARQTAALGTAIGAAGALGYAVAPLAMTALLPADGAATASGAAPFVIGSVSWGGALIAAPAAVLAAPVGARLARMADSRITGLALAALLALMGLTFLRDAGLG